jgi:hypothetical protein
MSIDTVQRLKEWHLITDMVRIAMAQDGDEDDDLKMEYNKKMDEDLANLKAKLGDIKNDDGQPVLQEIQNEATPKSEETSDLQAQLESSQAKVSSI